MNELAIRGETKVSGPINTYEYLLLNTLSSNFNPAKLRERVREVYFEQLDTESGDIPSLYRIVEYIDEENMLTIAEFYTSCGYDEEHVDQMIARYNHDVSCTLDDYVSDVLKSYGMSHSGDPYFVMFKRKYYDDDAQNILLRDFL